MTISSTFMHDRLCYIVHMNESTRPSEQIRRAVREALAAAGVGARRFEAAHGLRPWTLRGILDPTRQQAPSVDRAAEICAALGLTLSIGPPADPRADGEDDQDGTASDWPEVSPAVPPAVPIFSLEGPVRALARLVADAGGDPIPEELGAPPVAGFADSDARPVAAANENGVPPGARSVGTREVAAAAGGGTVNLDDAPVKGPVWFRRDWLDGQGMDPTRCVVISVRGESMEPTLPAGSKILVDRDRTRRRAGRIFVVATGEGLVVKRLERRGRQWFLASDHPSWQPVPWPREAEVIGEVRWASRTFE